MYLVLVSGGIGSGTYPIVLFKILCSPFFCSNAVVLVGIRLVRLISFGLVVTAGLWWLWYSAGDCQHLTTIEQEDKLKEKGRKGKWSHETVERD